MVNTASYRVSRSKAYRDRQGYVDTLREVVFTRADITDPDRNKYIPTAEAYQIPDITWELEGDKRTISTLGTLTIRFLKTDALVKFLAGLVNPAMLHINVSCYHLFFEKEKYPLWAGVLRDLPGGISEYPADKLELNFVAAPAKWPDGDNVKDPATATWFKNKHITDTVLPALLAEAFKAISGSANLETPEVYNAAPFFSSIDRPKKNLAVPAAPFDETCRVSGMAWDSHRNLLYVGVHDARGSATPPWLVSYDPETRKWQKLAQFIYGISNNYLTPPTEWEICYLEYDAVGDDLYYVCRTNHPALLEPKAHAHIRGVLNAAAIPTCVSLLDAGGFPLHDRGFKVRARNLTFDNRDPDGDPPSTDGVDYYGDMDMYAAGWATPRHEVKECGTFSVSPRIIAPFVSWGDYGRNFVRIGVDPLKTNHPILGMTVEIWEMARGYRQNLGKITHILSQPGYFDLTTERPVLYWDTSSLPLPVPRTILIPDADQPGENIFIAEPQEVSVECLYPAGQLPDPTTIHAERRRYVDAAESFFWPRDIASIDADEKILIDEVGYTAFSSVRDLGIYDQDNPATFVKYNAGVPIQFDVGIAGYRPAYSLVDGLYVSSAIQRRNHERPGKVGLYHNGALVYTSEGHKLETYGNIFLYRDNGAVYVAWNEHGQDSHGTWYPRCCQGRWNGATVSVDFRDRIGEDWRNYPERYITAYAHHKGRSYFGVRRYDRLWINLPMRLFWAAPPQLDISPRHYDGGYACLGAVKGDKLDVLSAGTVIRLRPTNGGMAGRKEYRIMDPYAGEREIAGGYPFYLSYLAPGESAGIYAMTWFTILALDTFQPGPISYNKAVGDEVRGRYITIAAGRDERTEMLIL
jgi:hypothetical protein